MEKELRAFILTTHKEVGAKEMEDESISFFIRENDNCVYFTREELTELRDRIHSLLMFFKP